MISGCVIPVAPDFQDPPLQQNYAPVLSADPQQGIVTTTTFTVTVGDPNVSDDLYVRWIAEYPPYSTVNTKGLKEDRMIPHSVNGMQLEVPDSITVDCVFDPLAPQLPLHPITALVSDAPFFTVAEDPTLDPETVLTGIRKGAMKAEAHWVLSLTCP
jgi:hypothetical protein